MASLEKLIKISPRVGFEPTFPYSYNPTYNLFNLKYELFDILHAASKMRKWRDFFFVFFINLFLNEDRLLFIFQTAHSKNNLLALSKVRLFYIIFSHLNCSSGTQLNSNYKY